MSDSTENSVENSGVQATIPARNGGRLLPGGKPGNRGGTGRPPNEFRARMEKLTDRKKGQRYLERCIDGEFGPKYHLAALAFAADRAFGKPNQAIDVTAYDFNPDDFSSDGLRRVAEGEDPVHVLSSGGRADADPA